jgi:hypothetical protein
MFAMAAFMAAYNGFSRTQMLVAKVTAVAAIGVAWFPMRCPTRDEIVPGAHVVSAIIPRLEFYCEELALIAFAVAWLAASHIVPWITAPEERWIRR